MAVVLGLASALVYGAGDFVGGLSARRTPALVVVALSQLSGLVLLAVLFPFLPEASGDAGDVAWGAAAGVGGSIGLFLLYRGLAIGRMSVVAPITAAGAATFPVVYGLLTGERPGPVALAGVVLALAAIVLVSRGDLPEPRGASVATETNGATVATERRGGLHQPGIPEALVAGVAFGAFFILLEQAADDAGLLPLVGTRTASVVLFTGVALAGLRTLRPAPGTLGLICFGGLLDMTANALYLLATQEGLLSLVAVLTSLYPASTVVLARVVLGERLLPTQLAGLGAALAGVGLIAAG